jgi:hypothetical protein
MVARPAPTYLAACNNTMKKVYNLCFYRNIFFKLNKFKMSNFFKASYTYYFFSRIF